MEIKKKMVSWITYSSLELILQHAMNKQIKKNSNFHFALMLNLKRFFYHNTKGTQGQKMMTHSVI